MTSYVTIIVWQVCFSLPAGTSEKDRRAASASTAAAQPAGASDPAAAAASALPDVDRALAELSSAPLELSTLYNAFAQPYGIWDICLQMIRFAGGGGGDAAAEPKAIARTLWDNEILRVWRSLVVGRAVGRAY